MSVFNNTDSLRANIISIDDVVINLKNDITRLGFISIGEAEGILEDGTYPFSFGMGQLSSATFGIPIPFDFILHKIGFTYDTVDTELTFSIPIVITSGTNTSSTITLNDTDKTYDVLDSSEEAFTGSAGDDLIIKVNTPTATTGAFEQNDKYRISLVYTSISNNTTTVTYEELQPSTT